LSNSIAIFHKNQAKMIDEKDNVAYTKLVR